jgi:RNA polymerase sigma-70 factor (ECF subfamily)
MAGGTDLHHPNKPATLVEPLPSDRLETARMVLAAKQDAQAFEPLYQSHVDAVYRYCFRRLSSSEAAADATSQVFIKAFTALHGCDEHRFRSWLFAIAHNVLIDEYRSRRPEEALDTAAELASSEPSPEELVLQDEDRLSVVKLLSFLTPDQKRVVELRLAGLNGNEIAEVLGRSRASVDTAQSRAISRLKAVFAQKPAIGSESEARHVPA